MFHLIAQQWHDGTSLVRCTVGCEGDRAGLRLLAGYQGRIYSDDPPGGGEGGQLFVCLPSCICYPAAYWPWQRQTVFPPLNHACPVPNYMRVKPGHPNLLPPKPPDKRKIHSVWSARPSPGADPNSTLTSPFHYDTKFWWEWFESHHPMV